LYFQQFLQYLVKNKAIIMSDTKIFEPGSYRYIPGARQYSAGVTAMDGYRLERVRFSRPVPLKEAFARIKEHLTGLGRPLAAFAACELRSPEPFTEQGFAEFNDIYMGTLIDWGLYEEGGDNPVARANVCPELHKPASPSIHAFTYTMPEANASPSFIVAGSAEAPEGKGDYLTHSICYGDVSPEGLMKKGTWVLEEMERRMAGMGYTWADSTATQLYTVHNIHHVMANEIAARGAALSGIDWHYNRPPVKNLEFEMDVRAVYVEKVLDTR
jgi:hypothetical protein